MDVIIPIITAYGVKVHLNEHRIGWRELSECTCGVSEALPNRSPNPNYFP